MRTKHPIDMKQIPSERKFHNLSLNVKNICKRYSTKFSYDGTATFPKCAKFCLQCYGSLNNNARPDKLCMRRLGELTKRTDKMEINMLIYHFMILQNNVQ